MSGRRGRTGGKDRTSAGGGTKGCYEDGHEVLVLAQRKADGEHGNVPVRVSALGRLPVGLNAFRIDAGALNCLCANAASDGCRLSEEEPNRTSSLVFRKSWKVPGTADATAMDTGAKDILPDQSADCTLLHHQIGRHRTHG